MRLNRPPAPTNTRPSSSLFRSFFSHCGAANLWQSEFVSTGAHWRNRGGRKTLLLRAFITTTTTRPSFDDDDDDDTYLHHLIVVDAIKRQHNREVLLTDPRRRRQQQRNSTDHYHIIASFQKTTKERSVAICHKRALKNERSRIETLAKNYGKYALQKCGQINYMWIN